MDSTTKYKSLAVALITTIIRYYNYALFGLSASLLSEEFFPGDNSGQMLGFFVVFSISALSRTFGAVIFGSISDKIGRVHSIKFTTILSLLSTIIIAFLPSFDILGIWSITLLTISRILFLSSLAGEVDAIKVFATEIVGKKHKHIIISLVTCCSQIGVIFASILYYTAISYDQFEWLWRANFLLGGLLCLLILFLRNNMQESSEFLIEKNKQPIELNQSTYSLILKHKVKFLIALIISGFIGSGYHFLIIFLNSFLSYTVGIITPQEASFNNMLLIAAYALACPIAGYITERVNNAAIYALIVNIILVTALMLCHHSWLIWLHLLIMITVPFYTIPCTIMVQSLFPSIIRVRMCSLAHAIGSLVLSSSTPLICMLIWQYTLSLKLVFGFFLCSLVCLMLAITLGRKIWHC